MKMLAGLVVLALLGCTTPQQRAQQQQSDYERQQLAHARYLNSLSARCQAYGLRLNTPEMSQCMMQADQANQNRNAQQNAAILSGIANQQQQPSPAVNYQYRMPTPSPVAPQQSTCRWIGSVWTCN